MGEYKEGVQGGASTGGNTGGSAESTGRTGGGREYRREGGNTDGSTGESVLVCGTFIADRRFKHKSVLRRSRNTTPAFRRSGWPC